MKTQNQITDRQNNEARQFAIAQLQAVMDAEKSKRAANIRAHAAAKKAAQAAANYTGPATLSAADSRAALADGIVANGDCATPGALDLPDGNPDAERVARRWSNRTSAAAYHIAAPWLLM